MAYLHVSTAGSDTTPYDTWAKAANSFDSAMDTAAAGDTIFVDSDHQETFAASNWNMDFPNGTQASPIVVISVNKDSGTSPNNPYQKMTDVTGHLTVSAPYDAYVNGYATLIGLNIISGDDLWMTTLIGEIICIDCDLKLSDNLYFNVIAAHTSKTFLYDVRIVQETAASANFPQFRGRTEWYGGSFSYGGSGALAALVNPSEEAYVLISDVDLSDIGAGDYLVGSGGVNNYCAEIIFRRCKLNASLGGVYDATHPESQGLVVKMHGCDDDTSDEYWRIAEHYYTGVVTTETSIHLDATYDGTNKYSISMATHTTAKEWYRPLRFKLAEVWCSANPTIRVNTLAGEAYNDDDFWIEFEYPNATNPATGDITRTRPATIQTTPSALSTEADPGWTEGASGFTTYQYVSEALTGSAGVYTVWACFAKASKTIYVCPKVEVT